MYELDQSNSPHWFVDDSRCFPQFYSFVSDTDDDVHPNELHYCLVGPNGPVYELRVYPDGTARRFTQTVYDMWMEDRAVGLDHVTWDESTFSDYYFDEQLDERHNVDREWVTDD